MALESVQFSSVAQSCLTLCNPIYCSTPDLPVHHQLRELAQAHVHPVGDAIQPSHPPSSPSPLTFDICQHQGLLKYISASHQVTKLGVSASGSVLPMNIQGWFPLGWTGLISLLSKGLLQHHSSKASILQHSAFFIVNSHIHTWLLEKPKLWLDGLLLAKSCLCFLICCLGWS